LSWPPTPCLHGSRRLVSKALLRRFLPSPEPGRGGSLPSPPTTPTPRPCTAPRAASLACLRRSPRSSNRWRRWRRRNRPRRRGTRSKWQQWRSCSASHRLRRKGWLSRLPSFGGCPCLELPPPCLHLRRRRRSIERGQQHLKKTTRRPRPTTSDGLGRGIVLRLNTRNTSWVGSPAFTTFS